MSKEAMKLEKIMEQAQVFASAWSLVGGRFDSGNMLDEAEAAKEELRQMVAEALAEQPAQPQQEPVATVIGKFLTRKDELRTCIEPELPLGTKLYTFPPAQRTWVGLSDGEIEEILADHIDDPYAVAFTVNHKLKEKNNGN